MQQQHNAAPADSSPSSLARGLAFLSIILAGVCGGLIGFAVTDLSCDDGCTTTAGFIGVLAAIVAAAGVAVVAVLVLRASAEWRAARSAATVQVETPDDQHRVGKQDQA